MQPRNIFKIAPLTLIIVGITMFAMQPTETIVVLTNDDVTIRIPRDIAMQSSMIRNMREDLGTSNAPLPIPLKAQSFNLAIRILQMINASSDEIKVKRADGKYIAQRIQPLIDRALAEENRSTVAELIYATEFLDLEQIANGAIRVFVQKAFKRNADATLESIKYLLSAATNWPISLNPVLEYQYQLVKNGNIAQLSVADYIAINGMPPLRKVFGKISLILNREGITSLEGLNQITDIATVEFMKLTGNALVTLQHDILKGLPKLKELTISYNLLTEFPDMVPVINRAYAPFSNLTSLEKLDLSKNKLETLPASFFNGLINLKTLNLNANELTTLPATIFNGTRELENLHISDNTRIALPPTVFNGLTKLKFLTFINTPMARNQSAHQFKNQYNLPADIHMSW